MKTKGYVPNMLGKSRFCRRLHRLAGFLLAMFFELAKDFKKIAGASCCKKNSKRPDEPYDTMEALSIL
jgi:hypothetical protein